MQEDKEAVFDAFDTVTGVLHALSATIDGLAFDATRCAAALEGGHLLAVELADYLVRKGMPFRRAHGVVGRLVTKAEAKGVDVSRLKLEDLREEAPEFDADVRHVLSVGAALRAKGAVGGTAPSRVKRSLAAWNRRVARW